MGTSSLSSETVHSNHELPCDFINLVNFLILNFRNSSLWPWLDFVPWRLLLFWSFPEFQWLQLDTS